MKEIACQSWSVRNEHGGGYCAQGKFKGKPSYGDCVRACAEHSGPWRDEAKAEMQMPTLGGAAIPTAVEPAKPVPGFGPGTELKKLLMRLGIEEQPNCPCNARMLQMDYWGVQGCRDHLEEIIGWMNEAKGFLSPASFAAAAAKVATSRLVFRINPLDPIRGIVTEAIRRAETKNG